MYLPLNCKIAEALYWCFKLTKATLNLGRCVQYLLGLRISIEDRSVEGQQCIRIIPSNCFRDLTCSTFHIGPLNPYLVARVFHFRPLFFSLVTLTFGTCHPERYMLPTQVKGAHCHAA